MVRIQMEKSDGLNQFGMLRVSLKPGTTLGESILLLNSYA